MREILGLALMRNPLSGNGIVTQMRESKFGKQDLERLTIFFSFFI